MAGRAVSAARKVAGATWHGDCGAFHAEGQCPLDKAAAARGSDLRARGVEGDGEGEGEGEFARAPLSSPGLTHAQARASCVQDLYSKLLIAAEDALDTVTSGRVRGRELQSHAYVATTLMRAAQQLERKEDDDAAPEQLEAEIERLQRELKKRS